MFRHGLQSLTASEGHPHALLGGWLSGCVRDLVAPPRFPLGLGSRSATGGHLLSQGKPKGFSFQRSPTYLKENGLPALRKREAPFMRQRESYEQARKGREPFVAQAVRPERLKCCGCGERFSVFLYRKKRKCTPASPTTKSTNCYTSYFLFLSGAEVLLLPPHIQLYLTMVPNVQCFLFLVA